MPRSKTSGSQHYRNDLTAGRRTTNVACRKRGLMKTFECRMCRQSFEYNRKSSVSGGFPLYCGQQCRAAKEAERIQARNVQDRVRRLARRDPVCGDCKQQLVLNTDGAKRDMHVYCSACLKRRKRKQDSRRNGVATTRARQAGQPEAPAEALPATRAA